MTSTGSASPDRIAIEHKVAFLSDPRSHPHAPATVEVIETSMSWVFLAGPRVFKLKKPILRDFLDFSTLDKRESAVREETRLNRRLAGDVYGAPRALRLRRDGGLSLAGDGEIVDWLVDMRRLPESSTLESRIGARTLRPTDVSSVVVLMARFYGALPPAELAPDDYVRQFAGELGKTRAVLTDPALGLDDPGLMHALDGFESHFEAVSPLLKDRVRAGRVVEGHGDLRPQHVFLTEPPAIIDCLEFSLRLRLIDPFDEIAFLGMECAQLGAPWIIDVLADDLAAALGEQVPPPLLGFYWRYRALLRARLALLHLAVLAPRTPAKWRPLARQYLALSQDSRFSLRPPAGR